MNGMETQERTVPQIELRGLSKVYQIPGGEVQALNNINLAIEQGDIYGIIGMSGAGKSTLIRCLNRLDTPTDGQVLIDGQNILAMSKKQLLQTRRRMAMIFQQFNLLMQKSVARNVRYPLEIAGAPKKQANERVMELLKIVGLEEKANAYPAQLSGGQKQRVALARARARNPEMLLCDEAPPPRAPPRDALAAGFPARLRAARNGACPAPHLRVQGRDRHRRELSCSLPRRREQGPCAGKEDRGKDGRGQVHPRRRTDVYAQARFLCNERSLRHRAERRQNGDGYAPARASARAGRAV